MFLGHFGIAFAAKKVVPAISLGALFVAAQFADLLWPLLVLAGVERVEIHPGITAVTPLDFIHYPYSHSLLALGGWAVAAGVAYGLMSGRGIRAFVVIAALVVSHWFIDVAVHRPDMPVMPDESTKLGLGIWNSIPATLAVEFLLFGAGVAMYARATRAVDATGRWAFMGLLAFLVAIYFAAVFGPPPPSAQAVAASGLAMWLLVAWGYWIDKHRIAA